VTIPEGNVLVDIVRADMSRRDRGGAGYMIGVKRKLSVVGGMGAQEMLEIDG